MEPIDEAGVALTAFDARTAAAVVAVLRRAGVRAWAGGADGDEVEVRVAEGQRDRAMRELGARMEEVRAEVVAARPRPARDEAAQPPARQPAAPPPDPDDVHAGPPLVMERFRSLRFLTAVVLAPLLVVTLAPSLQGRTGRAVALVLIALAVAGVLVARRRGR